MRGIRKGLAALLVMALLGALLLPVTAAEPEEREPVAETALPEETTEPIQSTEPPQTAEPPQITEPEEGEAEAQEDMTLLFLFAS